MRAHYLQHVPFEGLGHIEPWLRDAGFDVTCTHLFDARPTWPDLDELDLLIVMGGPMSVNDERLHPWLVDEKRLVRDAVERGMRVLGVCLGAQLVASALGARVVPSRFQEIGWFPVEGVDHGVEGAFAFPTTVDVFHWHGESLELPRGAVRLARSAACENQAFQLGSSVLGLQFHLETTPDSARELVDACREELAPDRFVQTEAEILGAPATRYETIHELLAKLLAHLCDGSAQLRPR